MGIFDTFFTETKATGFTAASERDAWISCVLACMYADGEVSGIEISKLSAMFQSSNVFGQNTSLTDVYKTAMANHSKYGGKALIDGSVQYIHYESRPTLFVKCAEIVLADGLITVEEKELLQYIADKFEITDEMAKKIIEVTLIRNKRDLTHVELLEDE